VVVVRFLRQHACSGDEVTVRQGSNNAHGLSDFEEVSI
jgi:hypothetical protein